MRIRIVQTPNVRDVDGVSLRHFVVGYEYVVSNQLGELMLAERWAEPAAEDGPALVTPLGDLFRFNRRQIFPARHRVGALANAKRRSGKKRR